LAAPRVIADTIVTTSLASLYSSAAPRFARCLIRQFRLPTFTRFLFEAFVIGGLFIASVWMCGEVTVSVAMVPMVVVTLVMMMAMIASGIYRREIWASVGNLYVHSAYGFVIAGSAALFTLSRLAPELLEGNFAFLFLLLTFFALNTVRPLVSGGELTTGVGRRAR